MKSLPGKFASARGGTLLLILLLGAGLFVAACGDEEVPAPTTPAPPPPPAPVPEPEPEPEAPAVPVGLMISATGLDFIEWSWTPVVDVSGYDVQYSANQAFTDEDEVIARTAEEFSYRREGLDPETSGYLRVRSASGTGDDRVTSDWSTHVTGTTMAAPPPPEPPAMPTGFMVSDATETSITWTWDAVEGATGYVVQVSMDEIFDDTILGNPETKLFDDLPFTTDTSYTAADLDPETTLYARVAAGAGTPTAPLVSAFTVHATGMTMAARLAAPANLEVKSRGHNFIEWQWDEVEGADGYQAQFSTDAGFSDPDNPLERPGVSNTSARVDNLESEADGYLRVRAYRGTLAARMFGDWSDADEATTEEAPPPEPLDAPENVRTSNVEDDSITLIWDEVDDAETYEVEFREEGASTWDDADCGDDSNVVTEEECVATGLDAATDYEFRVRGVPVDDDDDAHLVGAWSDIEDTRTAGTAAPEPTTPTPGGMGDLNIRWESDADSITWIWDRISGQTYDYVLVEEDVSDAPNPCATRFDGTLTGTESIATSYTAPSITRTAEDAGVRLLCVRTSDEENVSSAWGVVSPSNPTDGTPTLNDDENAVTALEWTSFDVVAGFDWEARLVADSERTNAYDVASAAFRTGQDMQNACGEGTRIDRGESDVRYTLDEIVARSGLQPYTGYVFCSRFFNSVGSTSWQVQPTKQFTYPARPSTPTIDAQRTSGQDVTWQLAVRNNQQVPRDDGGYEAKLIHYDETLPDPNDTTAPIRNISTKVPGVANCEDPAAGIVADEGIWNVVTEGATLVVSRNSAGIVVKATEIPQNSADAAATQGDTRANLCVRALSGNRNGPWVISSAREIKRAAE